MSPFSLCQDLFHTKRLQGQTLEDARRTQESSELLSLANKEIDCITTTWQLAPLTQMEFCPTHSDSINRFYFDFCLPRLLRSLSEPQPVFFILFFSM